MAQVVQLPDDAKKWAEGDEYALEQQVKESGSTRAEKARSPSLVYSPSNAIAQDTLSMLDGTGGMAGE